MQCTRSPELPEGFKEFCARVYNDAMNIIHYMHDKYYYEKAQMAFIDTNPRINLAYGVAEYHGTTGCSQGLVRRILQVCIRELSIPSKVPSHTALHTDNQWVGVPILYPDGTPTPLADRKCLIIDRFILLKIPFDIHNISITFVQNKVLEVEVSTKNEKGTSVQIRD